MNFKKSMSVLIAVAFSASVAACGTQTSPISQTSLTPDSDVNALAASDKYSKLANGDVIPGEFIVRLKSGSKASNSFKSGETVVKALGGNDTGMLLIKSTSEMTNMSANSNVIWSEPNRVMKLPKEVASKPDATKDTAAVGPNDPMFADQYAHKVSQSVEGWALAKASGKNAEVIIAIIDTGVDGTHPDLKAKLLPGYDAYGQGKEYQDKQGHGTHCAGIAAAIHDNGVGVAGYSVNSKIIGVKVLGDNGSGTYAAVADGIAWAAKSKADVLSMSLGGPSSSQALTDALALAVANNKIVPVATGNSGMAPTVPVSYPAFTPGAFAVGATDSNDKLANFSQTGKHVAVTAPGVNIMSTFPTYASGMPAISYGKISGTSMATPGAAGLAALVKSVNPSLKATQIADILKKSADDLGAAGRDDQYGSGRINTLKAVKLALGRKI